MHMVILKSKFKSKVGLFAILTIVLAATTLNTYPTQAETGRGEDIFRVILTIFEADKSKGDVVAIVTANNGEASRVKFLDIDTLVASNLTGSTTATTTS